MAYAQVSDITARAPGIELTASSKPSAGQATAFLADIERDVNAALTNLGYVTPIVQADSPLAFSIVKDKVAYAALARVLMARALGASQPKEQGAEAAQAVYDDWMRALGNPNSPIELPDATRTGEAVEKDGADRVSSFVQGVAATDRDVTPRITMRQVF